MKAGDICDGIVTRIENFGLFVDVAGIPGLLRIPEALKQLRSELEIYMLDDKKLVQDSVFALALAVASGRDSEYLAKPAMGGLYYGGEI
jgi:predicted RNA-binding protein with RPS1 domain